MTEEKGKTILVTGGCRSGKSGFALGIAGKSKRKAFLATAKAVDREMADRIKRHRKDRGRGWTTIEEPLDLAGSLRKNQSRFDAILIDCITIWVSNLLIEKKHPDRSKTIREFLKILKHPKCTVVIVTNEVGSGVVPANELAREFRDLAGEVNQKIAKLCDEVYLLVSGIPVRIKGN
jgi:adenosylcobinamide kinase/adenosylcobinamide-phosphate guanylyltransferase